MGKAIKNLTEYLEEIKRIQEEWYDRELFYRGDHNIAEPMPKIAKNIDAEHMIINEVLSLHPKEFQNKHSAFDKLALMQHYGCPTRLLDITSNPLVALYFACGDCGDYKNKCVFIFSISLDLIKYPSSDTVSVLSNIAMLPPFKLIKDAEETVKKFNRLSHGNYKIIYDYDVDEQKFNLSMDYLVSQIQHEKPSFKNNIAPEHLDNCILCVKPSYDDQRMIAQQGAFLLFGIKRIDKKTIATIDNKTIKFEKLSISGRHKKEIKREIEKFAGITEKTLFPDIEHTAKYAHQTYFPDVRKIKRQNILSAIHEYDSVTGLAFNTLPPDIRKKYYFTNTTNSSVDVGHDDIMHYHGRKYQLSYIIAAAYFDSCGIMLKQLSDDQYYSACEHFKVMMKDDIDIEVVVKEGNP